MARAPELVFRHSRSGLPSPLKSPTLAITQAGGTLPRPRLPTTAPPFISHITTLPVSCRHTMSALPSPLKSPTAAIVHTVATVSSPALPTTLPPFIDHRTSAPEDACLHR